MKAQSLESSKLHDATCSVKGELFYGPSKEGSLKLLLINALNVLQYIHENGKFDTTINIYDNFNYWCGFFEKI